MPYFFFQTLLFLVALFIQVMTCFLVTSCCCSLRFLLLFLLQLFKTGLCQLHSTSAQFGSIYYFHSSSLLFLMCSIKSLIYLSQRVCYSFGSLTNLFQKSSEYRTILCNSMLFWHHWNSLQALIYLSSSSLPNMYWLHSFMICLTVSVYPMHLLHHSCSYSSSWCLIFRVFAEPSQPVLSLKMYKVS